MGRFASVLFKLASLVFLGAGFAEAKMVYLHEKGDVKQIALAEDDGSLLGLLTSPHKDTYHPDISADGRYVAYSIGTIKPNKVDVAIHVEDLETGDIEVWTPSGNQYIHAEFSGNGEYLAFSGPVNSQENKVQQKVHLIHLPTERLKGPARIENESGRTVKYFKPQYEILPESDQSYFPAVASDGSFVVYHRTKDTSSHEQHKEVFIYDRQSKKTSRITDQGKHGMVPSLSSDNRHVAYAGIRNGQWDIYIYDLWRQEERRLTHSEVREFTPVFAPDGSITYTHISGTESIELDLYRIPKEQVFGSTGRVQPEAFVAEAGVFEYVPSFSGDQSFSLLQYPELPAPARSSFGAIQHEGKVFVAGGHQGPEHTYPPESFLNRLDIFETKTRTWTQGASMSVPRHGFEMVAYGNYVYAFGGFAYSAEHTPGWKSLDLIERYDIAKDQWEVLPVRLPRNRSSNVAALVGTKVYLMGGWDSTPKAKDDVEGRFHREIDVFDLITEKTFVSDQQLPDPLRRAFTGVVQGDEIYLIGGISEGASHFDWVDRVTRFAPVTGEWTELAPLPFATFAPGAGIYKNKLFFFGGMSMESGYLNTLYSLELSGDSSWTNTGRYLKENKGFPIVVDMPLGGLGILGGHTYLFTEDGVIDTPVSTFEVLK